MKCMPVTKYAITDKNRFGKTEYATGLLAFVKRGRRQPVKNPIKGFRESDALLMSTDSVEAETFPSREIARSEADKVRRVAKLTQALKVVTIKASDSQTRK